MAHEITILEKMPEDFARELEDDESVIKDVALVGTDGGRVPAMKGLLAIRSPVFRRMFYGDFQESNSSCDSVELNYPAPVLRAVVTYCYTNLTDFEYYFAEGEKDKDEFFDQSDSSAVALVQLLDAANYLGLFELRAATMSLFMGIGNFEYSTCAILQELSIRGDIDGELWKICMKVIEEDSNASLFPWEDEVTNAGIRGTSFPLLETIVRHMVENINAACTYEAVKALKLWNEAHDSATEEERSKLRNLADSLDFGHIKIGEFEGLTPLKPCPLFPLKRCFFPLLESTLSSDKLDAYYTANLLKSWNEARDSITEEERSKLLNFADKVDLESLQMVQLLKIKPCPLFPAERLHSVLVKTCKKLNSWLLLDVEEIRLRGLVID